MQQSHSHREGFSKKLWQELYSYESEIYSFIKNAVGNGDVARDLYQDVYLTVLQNLHQLDEQRSLKNWLYTVTRNRVINYFRFHRRREFSELNEDNLQTLISEGSEQELIRSVIDQLPERQREILLLREIEGWSYTDLAQRLQISESAVTSLLTRARENFQKQYILKILPAWFAKAAENISLNDVFRFLNPFNPPVNVLEKIDKQCSEYFARIKSGWNCVRKDLIEEENIKAIIDRLLLSDNMIAADFGAGTGLVSSLLAEKNIQAIAIEVLPEMIFTLKAVKQKNESANLHVIRADVRRTPLKKESLNAVFFVLILHHIADPIGLLVNQISLLKQNGYLVLIDFLRHENRKSADEMQDLWLGFDPQLFKKGLKKSGLKLREEGQFKGNKGINSFFQIWQK